MPLPYTGKHGELNFEADLIEMLRNNSVKIKAIDYKYNPEDDNFVAVSA